METPKKQAMSIIKQLPEEATWKDIMAKLGEAQKKQPAAAEYVDWDGFMRRVKTILYDEFPEADQLKFELDEDGRRMTGYVVSREFNGMEDADRQDRVWDVLENNLSVEEQSRILSILALTPDESSTQGGN